MPAARDVGTIREASTVEIPNAQVQLIDEIAIPAREAGVVQELLATLGDLVTEDQLLARMDDRQLVMQLEAAELEAELARIELQNNVDLRYAEKSQAVSQAELKRMQEANQKYARSVSRSEMEETQLVAERASLAAEQAVKDMDAKRVTVALREKQVDLLASRLENMRIRAPSAGMITEITARPGEWVQIGEPTMRMVRLDRLRVTAFVDGHRFDQGLQGAAVVFRANLPPDAAPAEFRGTIRFVSPRLVPNSRQLEISASIENPELRLRAGIQGTLRIAIP